MAVTWLKSQLVFEPEFLLGLELGISALNWVESSVLKELRQLTPSGASQKLICLNFTSHSTQDGAEFRTLKT